MRNNPADFLGMPLWFPGVAPKLSPQQVLNQLMQRLVECRGTPLGSCKQFLGKFNRDFHALAFDTLC